MIAGEIMFTVEAQAMDQHYGDWSEMAPRGLLFADVAIFFRIIRKERTVQFIRNDPVIGLPPADIPEKTEV